METGLLAVIDMADEVLQKLHSFADCSVLCFHFLHIQRKRTYLKTLTVKVFIMLKQASNKNQSIMNL